MSGLAKVLLVEWFPRAGFRWRRGQGSPRILRSDSHDAVVQRAIIELHGGKGGGVRKRDAQALVVEALETMAGAINDPDCGIRPGEGILDFLERAARFAELSGAIPEDVWIELVYQIVNSRAAYERKTPAAQKLGDRDQLTALAHAADGLLDAAGKHWDWMALEFYALPHLMGEAADYEVVESSEEEEEEEEEEESEWEEDEADREWREAEERDRAEREREEREKAEEEARKKAVAAEAAKLPRKMEDLDIDGDGDVQMED